MRPVDIAAQRARLTQDPRRGTPAGFWHIYRWGSGKAHCGYLMTGNSFGFVVEFPSAENHLIDFYCPECLKHRPVQQLTLFGD